MESNSLSPEKLTAGLCPVHRKAIMKYRHTGSTFSSLSLKIGGVFLFLLFTLVSTGWAAPPVRTSATKEALLKKVQTLIRSDESNATNLQQAVTLLKNGLRQYPEDPQILLKLAEATYRQADPSADIDKTFPLYARAGALARKALDVQPKLSEGHYWHGLFLLKKAQKVGGLRAFFIVRDGIKELDEVRKELPAYDHGGAARVLGLLYCVAPGWSPFGDVGKSIALEKEAIQVAPNYLLNRLYLARAYQKKGDEKAAVLEYRKMLAITPAATDLRNERRYQDEARQKLASLGQPLQANSSPILPD